MTREELEEFINRVMSEEGYELLISGCGCCGSPTVELIELSSGNFVCSHEIFKLNELTLYPDSWKDLPKEYKTKGN